MSTLDDLNARLERQRAEERRRYELLRSHLDRRDAQPRSAGQAEADARSRVELGFAAEAEKRALAERERGG
jgi:hypothetical protein